MKAGLLAGNERADEGLILGLAHGTIDIVGPRAGGTRLVVARLPPGDGRIDAIEVHDRGDGIEKRQCALAGEILDGSGEGGRGQGPGGDDDAIPTGWRPARNLAAL